MAALPHCAVGKAHGYEHTVGTAVDAKRSIGADAGMYQAAGIYHAIVAMAIDDWFRTCVVFRKTQWAPHMDIFITGVEDAIE